MYNDVLTYIMYNLVVWHFFSCQQLKICFRTWLYKNLNRQKIRSIFENGRILKFCLQIV